MKISKEAVKISEYPPNFIPAGAIAISETEDGCTVKGFFDRTTEETHIQEVIYDNQSLRRMGGKQMSSRCKACNVILFDEELTTKDTETGEYLELCFACKFISDHPDDVKDYYDTSGNNHYEE